VDAAVAQLKQVVALNPKDTLSANLLSQLQPPAPIAPGAGAAPAGAPAVQPPAGPASQPPAGPAAPLNTTMPEGASLSGTWTAHPSDDTTVTLTMQPGGSFTWKVNAKGQPREFAGSSSFGAGVLTLVPDKMPPLVGRLSWADPDHMTFRVVGEGPESPGLSFAK